MRHIYQSKGFNDRGILKRVFQSISVPEILVFTLFGIMVFSVIFISIWNTILLATGKTQGGGPLGMMARMIIELFQ